MPTDLPNLLTLSRIAAIPLLVALMAFRSPGADAAACAVFAVAGITDYLDGRLARDWSQTSDFGRMLDPIADKLLVGAVLFMLAAYGRLSPPSLLPALIILLREILVSGLREFLAELRVGMPVTRLAKWKTGLQMVALPVLLVGDAGPAILHPKLLGEVCLWTAALLTLITGWDYLRASLDHIRGAE